MLGLTMASISFSQTQKHSTKGKGNSPVKKSPPRVAAPLMKAVQAPPIKKDTTLVIKQDPVNLGYKGPYGEPIYSGSDGRLYYIDKNDQRVYINLEK